MEARAVGAFLARNQVWLTFSALFVWIVVVASLRGGDANWDLRNYHFYDPFALFHKKPGVDIAPAAMQSYLLPLLDIPYYLLARRVHSIPVLNAILALPQALAVGLSFLLSVRLLEARDVPTRLIATVAVLIGATGAATFSVLATTQSDMIPVSLILASLLLMLTADPASRRFLPRLLAAGIVAGVAVGLKLTTACAGVGTVAALAALPGLRPRQRLGGLALMGGGAVGGMLATCGWWWLRIWRETGNPLFPFYNNLFHSPLVVAASWADLRFMPHGFLQAVFYPFIWAVDARPLVGEAPMRDPRFALAIVAALILVLRRATRRTAPLPALWAPATAFLLAGFVAWEKEFSILRYLSSAELLTGTIIAMAALAFVRSRRGRGLVLAGMVLLALGLRATTLYPGIEQADRAGPPIAVDLPAVAPDAMVLLLDGNPMAYLAAFEPSSARFIGVHDALVALDRNQGMQHLVQRAIDSQRGEIWGLELPQAAPGEADASLRFYGLHRTSCTQVRSNLDYSLIRMCRLERNAAAKAG